MTLRRLAVIGALALAVVGLALADHSRKASQMHRADVAWWYCVNEHTGCGTDPERVEHRADRIEQGWQRRERGYTLLVGALIGAAAMAILAGRRRGTHVLDPSSS